MKKTPSIHARKNGFVVKKGFRAKKYQIGFVVTYEEAVSLFESCVTEEQAIEMQSSYFKDREATRANRKQIRRSKASEYMRMRRARLRSIRKARLAFLRSVHNPMPLEERVIEIRKLTRPKAV